MYKTTVELKFCCAHRLPDHKGKCRFIHGHNYRVLVTLRAPETQADGMLLDFGIVKKAYQQWLDETYDHRLVLCNTDPLLEVMQALPVEQYNNIEIVERAPTAENMAARFFHNFNLMILGKGWTRDVRVVVDSVKVYETDTSCAEYTWEDVK